MSRWELGGSSPPLAEPAPAAVVVALLLAGRPVVGVEVGADEDEGIVAGADADADVVMSVVAAEVVEELFSVVCELVVVVDVLMVLLS